MLEARSPDGSQFGGERLSALLAEHAEDGPDALVAACADAVHVHTRGRLGDDLTLVALARVPGGQTVPVAAGAADRDYGD